MIKFTGKPILGLKPLGTLWEGGGQSSHPANVLEAVSTTFAM